MKQTEPDCSECEERRVVGPDHRNVSGVHDDGCIYGNVTDATHTRDVMLAVTKIKRDLDDARREIERLQNAVQFATRLANAAEWLSLHPNDVNGWADMDRHVVFFRAALTIPAV